MESTGLTHRDYMLALGAAPARLHYPGYNREPLAAYGDLCADLTAFGAEFLAGDAGQLRAASRAAEPQREQARREARSAAAGDLRFREAARLAFRAGRYAEVEALFARVSDPGLLPGSEREMQRIARARVTRGA